MGACLLHQAIGALWGFCDAANRLIDAERPWSLAKTAADDQASPEARAAARQRLEAVLGDLVEACRLFAVASAPLLPATATTALASLGYTYPYGSDGSAAPGTWESELRWGAHADEPGRVSDDGPLFPRLLADSPA